MYESVSEFGVAAWSQICQISILIAVACLMQRHLLPNRPKWTNVVWIIVMLKCVTPPVVASPTSVFSWAQLRVQPIEFVPDDQLSGGDLITQFGSQMGQWFTQPSCVIALLAIWAVGFVLLIARWWWHWRTLLRHLADSSTPSELRHMVDQIRGELQIRQHVDVVVSSEDFGPAVLGFARPMIVLPQSLTHNVSIGSLRPLIVHELMHVRRHDAVFGALQMLVAAIWWFHPMIWWAIRRSNANIEECVDASVVGELRLPANEYANGILQVLETRIRLNGLAGMPGVRSHEVTKDRIKKILSIDLQRTTSIRCLVVFAALLGLAVLPGKSLEIPTSIFVDLHRSTSSCGGQLDQE